MHINENLYLSYVGTLYFILVLNLLFINKIYFCYYSDVYTIIFKDYFFIIIYTRYDTTMLHWLYIDYIQYDQWYIIYDQLSYILMG